MTVVTFATNGVYTWTCPVGITTAQIECWGAGGGGGTNIGTGGGGGGGGEYAAETSLAVHANTAYQLSVGAAGAAGAAGNPSTFTTIISAVGSSVKNFGSGVTTVASVNPTTVGDVLVVAVGYVSTSSAISGL